jgi:serine/threonine-protein phosphatase 2B catalytic subunit
MIKMFRVLREQNEDILKLKGLCPDNKLPRGVLLGGSTGIKDAICQFEAMKKADMMNEKRPINSQ